MATFSKKQRIARNVEFKQIFSKGRRIKSASFILIYLLNDFSYGRLGLIIGKKFMKRAHDRNRLRRVVREYFRKKQEAFAGRDIVVVLRGKPGVDVREEIEELFGRIKA